VNEYIETSVMVKWFKRDEDELESSLALRKRFSESDDTTVVSTYAILEIVRALKKGSFDLSHIEDTLKDISDMSERGELDLVSVDEILTDSIPYIIDLNLYASDALHAATAVATGCTVFWSADKHHLKDRTRNYLANKGVEVRELGEA